MKTNRDTNWLVVAASVLVVFGARESLSQETWVLERYLESARGANASQCLLLSNGSVKVRTESDPHFTVVPESVLKKAGFSVVSVQKVTSTLASLKNSGVWIPTKATAQQYAKISWAQVRSKKVTFGKMSYRGNVPGQTTSQSSLVPLSVHVGLDRGYLEPRSNLSPENQSKFGQTRLGLVGYSNRICRAALRLARNSKN